MIYYFKENGTLRLIDYFISLNKRIQSKPWNMSKIQDDSGNIGGSKFNKDIDFNMEYYTMRLE